jgi:hypothetical protein
MHNFLLLLSGTLLLSFWAHAQEGYSQYTGSGSLGGSGSITQERVVTGTTAGWRLFSTPFTSTPFNALGSVNIGAGNNNVITLNTATTNAWVGLHTMGMTSASAMGAGKGYMVYFGGTAPNTGVNGTTVSTNVVFSGTPNNSNVTVSGLANGSGSSGSGWSVVGNPFNSGITFDSLTRTNIDNAYYIWDATAGTWASYVNGVSSPSGKLAGIIPPMQGFLVKANAASPALTFPTSARTTSSADTQMRHASNFSQLLYLRISDAATGRGDETAILAHPMASMAFEGSYDAYKLNSWTTGAINLATRSSDGHLLSIQATGEWDTTLWVPMQVNTTQNGSFSIEADFSAVDPGQPIWLEDMHLDVQHDLRSGAYTYTHTSNLTDRFRIHFRALSAVNVQLTGTVRYAHLAGMPMPHAEVRLNNVSATGSPASLAVAANAQGEFNFPVVAAGQYALSAVPVQAWGGVNATDAMLVARHFLGQHSLTGIALSAADVTGGGVVNATDALSVLQRYTGQSTGFGRGDFVSAPGSLVLGGQPTQSQEVLVLATGDVNMSYVPGTALRQDARPLSEQGTLWLSDAGVVEVPIYMASDRSPAAVSLEWVLPKGTNVLDVLPSIHSVSGFSMQQRDQVCRVAWYGLQSTEFKAGDELCRLRVTGATEGLWSLGTATEMADERGQVMADAALRMPRLIRSGGQTGSGSAQVWMHDGQLFVRGISGPYSLELLDARGRIVWSIRESTADLHRPETMLPAGVYTARMVSTWGTEVLKIRVY